MLTRTAWYWSTSRITSAVAACVSKVTPSSRLVAAMSVMAVRIVAGSLPMDCAWRSMSRVGRRSPKTASNTPPLSTN